MIRLACAPSGCFRWASALPRPALGEFYLGGGEVGQVGLIAEIAYALTDVVEHVVTAAGTEAVAHPAVGSPHRARHADCGGRGRPVCHECTPNRVRTRAELTPLCSYTVSDTVFIHGFFEALQQAGRRGDLTHRSGPRTETRQEDN